MIAKLFIVASAIAAVYSQADRYPAGVNPHLCPNYPHCDNSLLAAYNPPAATAAAPRWGAPQQYAPQAYVPQAAPLAAPVGHAAQYPAGVNPASCPNYPYCSNHVAAAPAVAPLPGFSARLYPDGVNPSVCPNYPYCH